MTLPLPAAALSQHVIILGKTIVFGRADRCIVPTDIDKAYAAGFFDGEGAVTIGGAWRKNCRHKIIYNMRVGAAQVDLTPLCWLRDRWGGSIRPVKRRTTIGNQTYIWGCFGRGAAEFLRDVLPYLKVKQPHAELALRFQASKFIPGVKGHDPSYHEMHAAMKAELSQINGHKPNVRKGLP